MLERLGLEEVMLGLRSEGGKEELYDEEDAAEREWRLWRWCFPLGHSPLPILP